jgi:hypothetical protein
MLEMRVHASDSSYTFLLNKSKPSHYATAAFIFYNVPFNSAISKIIMNAKILAIIFYSNIYIFIYFKATFLVFIFFTFLIN